MLSASRRFSSASSASGDYNAKSFMPPKPNFNSPKLVQDSQPAHSLSAPIATSPDAFAPSSSCASQRTFHGQPEALSRYSTKSGYRHDTGTAEFGTLRCNSEQLHTLEECFRSPAPSHVQLDLQGRCRSSTLGNQPTCPPPAESYYDVQLSSQPIKSQFDDDSEDEEMSHNSRSLAGFPNRARLAALGTASRLFKGRRHSRAASNTQPLMHLQTPIAPLKIEKRRSRHNEAAACRPATSDGAVSPAPRQAVFGHRPSPSQLSLAKSDKSDKSSKSDRSYKSDKPCSGVTQADRDLILALQGCALKPKPKASEPNKVLSKLREQARDKHSRQQSVQLPSAASDRTSQWRAHPHCCFSDTAALLPRGPVRKSQSLSSLRFESNRKSGRLSPAMEQDDLSGSEENVTAVPMPAEPSVWQTMIDSSPSTYSEHSSLSSCASSKHSEEGNLPCKPTFRPKRLPPQKPPPQQGLPPPPLPPKIALPKVDPVASPLSALIDADMSFLSPNSPSIDAGCVRARGRSAATDTQGEPLASCKGNNCVDGQSFRSGSQSELLSATERHEVQIELNVGGTKFTTFASTLRGLPCDKPRLVEILCRGHDGDDKGAEAAMPGSSSNRVNMGAGNERAVACVEACDARSETALSIGTWRFNASQSSSSSPSNLALQSDSQEDSDASSGRRSDVSDTDRSIDSARAGFDRPRSEVALPAASPSSDMTKSIFLDRNGDLYRDIFYILRTHKLPFRLLACSTAAPSHSGDDAQWSLARLKLQLRCRLHEVKDEAEWLGYCSIVQLCEEQLCQT